MLFRVWPTKKSFPVESPCMTETALFPFSPLVSNIHPVDWRQTTREEAIRPV